MLSIFIGTLAKITLSQTVFHEVQSSNRGRKTNAWVISHLCYKISSDPQLQELVTSAESDENYKQMVNALMQPKKKISYAHPIQAFDNVRNRLSVHDSGLIILDDSRIVVPTAQRKNILNILHKPHAGIVKTRKLAQQLYYWPGMNNDIKTLVTSCSECQRLLPSLPKQPLVITEAQYPMEQVGIDLIREWRFSLHCNDRSLLYFCFRQETELSICSDNHQRRSQLVS